MIPSSILAHIRSESIAGHEAAIDKIVESVAELMPLHKNKKMIDAQINQQLAGYRCLLEEWKIMTTSRIDRTQSAMINATLCGTCKLRESCDRAPLRNAWRSLNQDCSKWEKWNESTTLSRDIKES